MLPAILERYLNAYNAKDVDAMLACVSDDVVFEHVTNGDGGTLRLDGKAALAEQARAAAPLFATRQQAARRVVGHGDAWALEVDFAAVVAVDLPNGWRAGQTVRLRGASFFRLRDGVICEQIDIS